MRCPSRAARVLQNVVAGALVSIARRWVADEIDLEGAVVPGADFRQDRTSRRHDLPAATCDRVDHEVLLGHARAIRHAA